MTDAAVSASITAALHSQPPAVPRTCWSGVYAMSLCAFVLIASEFMPVSLLTPIAHDLRVTEGQAGWGIGISGVFAVLTSLLLPKLVGQCDRRTVLLAMTAMMGASGAVIATAPNYEVYMAGRALIGVVVGGFWSMSVAVAMRLVPTAQIARAMAIFNGGNALATVLAAPLGSYLGGLAGWRGVFWCLVPLAVMTMIWQRLSLPSLPARTTEEAATTNVFALFASQRIVTLGMLACGLFFMGQFTLYTYVRPFLETVTRLDADALSLALLAIGGAGVVGNALIGHMLQHSLYGTLVGASVLMAALAAALLAFGHIASAVIVLFSVWGLTAISVPVGWWSWLAKTLPHNSETGGALMVAVIQLSIGFGSIAGGVLWDGIGGPGSSGPAGTFILSSILLLAAAGLAWLTARTAHPASVQRPGQSGEENRSHPIA